MERSTSTKTFTVWRFVTCTLRRLTSGPVIMNRWAITDRSHLSSKRTDWHDSGGSGTTFSPTRCRLDASRQISARHRCQASS